jgi:hypothetical protein
VSNVRYIHVDRQTTLGEKLNIGINESRGEIIQKWDDDDYHHPGFIQCAVSHLPVRERGIVVWDCFLVLLAGERSLRHSGCGWTTGATMCFRRDVWARKPFRDVERSEDSLFLADHSGELIRVCAAEYYIVVRHGRNTWTRMEDASPVDEYFWNLPSYPKPLQNIVHPKQVGFYRTLTTEPFAISG